MQATNPLFTTFKLGPLKLPNRAVMAPLTRGRADTGGVPNDLMASYYAQRAAAGLMITEATAISSQGFGWAGAPGIFTDAQVTGWQKVTHAVHNTGGRIFLQLWHMGRVSHPDFQEGELPVGPSAVAASGEAHTHAGSKPYVTPRPLAANELPGIVGDYVAATQRARAAGFDGVEIHSANGYLLDQFLRDGSNHRNDSYGGHVANRARLLIEVAEAVTGAWSADRVGVRLSPTNAYNDMRDSKPHETFPHTARELSRFGLAYLHVFEGLPGHWSHLPGERVSPLMRAAFKGPFMSNGGYDAQTAAQALDSGETDLIAFGVPFLANPDFLERVRRGAPLNPPDMATFYTPGPRGYIDYPTLTGVAA